MIDPAMHLLYVHSTAIGYARYGVKLADALTRAGVKIDDRLDPDHPDPHHLVCWVSTPVHAAGWFDGQHAVLSSMWETQNMPESFREGMHNFDRILVPSDQNVELFGRYHPNVTKVPLGVDTTEWAYRPRQPPVDTFKFLIGGSGTRKGLDLAYKAFRKVFKTWPGDMPRPTLQFKSPRPVEYVGERIEVIGGRISDQAERDLYGAAHCYLQPSRGEGFGLQPLQAIAQGLPTVLTDAHGHADFAQLGYPISATSVPADYFIYGDAGLWWEPSLDELCQQMEYVYYHYDEACALAQISSKIAHERFSWERCADNFMAAIGRDRFATSYRGAHRWVKPELKRYKVMVTKPWQAEIAGSVYQFHPGSEYWEVADIKRVLWEGDILDPACVVVNPAGELTAEETGLTDGQLAELPEYTAAHSYCWTCGQKLNSGERYDPAL